MPERSVIVADKAPAALGPYSAAVRVGPFVYCSGQTPIVPETGELVEGCVACQTKQVLSNVSAVLEAAGLTLADVVKTTVFLTDMGDFAHVEGRPMEPEAKLVEMWSRYGNLRAEQSHNVRQVGSEIFIRPGPRMGEAARQLKQMIHGAAAR